MTDIADLSASATLARIAAGTLSFGEVREALAARIAEREPVVRAFVHLNPEPTPGPGPLAGTFFGAKDVLDTADMPSQYGNPIWAGWQPRADAACVALAKTAGGAVIGKTVTTEFATRFPGPTTNPHNPAHTPGGSSSGSAAGVAAGFFHVGLGTQTGGSILRPAAYCGVVGFKPSFGALHRGGMKVMSESLDTAAITAGRTPPPPARRASRWWTQIRPKPRLCWNAWPMPAALRGPRWWSLSSPPSSPRRWRPTPGS
jgi:Asp-tRNA(Asn)/Glu-tRNA(Gln) amidotransferase A subunit family amidase